MMQMDKEINVMKERKVWDLVDHPDNIKILENRWVYTIKYDENNKIVRYKARLVARGGAPHSLRNTDVREELMSQEKTPPFLSAALRSTYTTWSGNSK
ncbi:hypothetical protein TNCV_3874761 [Trichonephila clavipes]|nr:hypothetical protein TNCV_3874761 [Trichonephila clavipes]